MSGIQQSLLMYGSAKPLHIANGLRFRSSASAYLSRTITLSAVWTLSVWVKRGALGIISPILGGSVLFNANDTLTAGTLTTTSVFRDPSAWYNIVVNNSNVYVNGVSVGSTSTGILVNPNIGNYLTSYFDGYIADMYFIGGSSLPASSFGAFDSVTGVWKPITYSGSYGAIGFHLNFSNGTSTTTLGYDSSGNGNNWTTNNISLTAGSTYDWMIDSPTSFAGTSYGVGNYAVLNPLSNLYGSTISNGNLTGYCSVAQSGVSGTIKLNSGAWYYEYTVQGTGSPGRNWIGYLSDSYPKDDNNWTPGSQILLYANDGTGAVTYAAYGASYTTGDVIGVAFNIDIGTLTFYKNGVSQGTLTTTASGTNWRPSVTYGATGWTGSINFGQRPFAYTPPSGYKSLCTYNLPAGTVTTSGTFTGNASATGPFVWLNGVPTAMTINGNAVTFGTHADKTAGGFQVITSSSSYNASGSNTYSITTNGGVFKNQDAQPNP